jgi:hypothetical protein
MVTPVELSTLNPRLEGHRLRDDTREAHLLASIAERGIEKPLEGVDLPSVDSLETADPRAAGGRGKDPDQLSGKC